MTVTSLRNREQGHRWPDLGVAYRLAKALGVPLESLGEIAAQSQTRDAGGPKKRDRAAGSKKPKT